MARLGGVLILALLLAACGGQRSAVERQTEPAATASQPAAPASSSEDMNQDGVIRVVAIGDSLAYGTGDESGEGIAGRLEDELRARGITSIDTQNLGVNGAQTSDLITRLKQERTRKAVADADAIVLSIGANDLFRTPGAREETLKNPLLVAGRILTRLEEIVAELHRLAPKARILILGGYNPVPNHPYASMINQYLALWDGTITDRFAKDSLVTIVKMSDIVNPQRLSRLDHFHPGGAAYGEAAKRIAEIIVAPVRA